MGWFWAWCIFLSVVVAEGLTSDVDSQLKRDKRQMHVVDNVTQIFPTARVGNTLQLKYFYDRGVAGSKTVAGINRMIKLFEDRTCLKFVEVNQEGDDVAKITRTIPDWLIGQPGSTGPCYRSRNVLKMNEGCGDEKMISVFLHEFMHLLGFKHLFQRADRDKYINIEVTRGKLDVGFALMKDSATEFPFDYGSILGYPENSRCDDKICYNITVKDEKYRGSMIGQTQMQYYDYYMVNHYYKCLDFCDQKNHQCQNHGYPYPKDCSRCVCPPGFGGQFCTERETGCGETYSANSEWKMIKKLEKPGLNPDAFDERCFHLITAPPGKWIEYDISIFSPWRQYHLFFYGNDDVRMSPYNFNKESQPAEQLDLLRHGVFRGNALRFQTEAFYAPAFTTTVKYRYVDADGSVNTPVTTTTTPLTSTTTVTTTTTTPTSATTTTSLTTTTQQTTTTTTTTRDPEVQEVGRVKRETEEEEINYMVGHRMCAPKQGEAQFGSLFDKDVVRSQLQMLTNSTRPKFMIMLTKEQGDMYCPGRELLDYQLAYDTSSDQKMNDILFALYGRKRDHLFPTMPPLWYTFTADEMTKLYDSAPARFRSNGRSDSMDVQMHQGYAPPFAMLRGVIGEQHGLIILVDEAM